MTKNEYVYESYSEDEESDAPAEKSASTATGMGVKSGAVGGKKKKDISGQKNLMSFFGKK